MGASEPGENARTLAAYEQEAERYRAQTQALDKDEWLELLARQAPPGTILEIGSAYGRDADDLEAMGRHVHRTDATHAFVAMQRSDGHAADLLNVLTDEITGPYAAVLANAVFLHFRPDELRTVLTKVHAALASGGVLAFSVKVGDGAEWSSHKLGVPRFFQYWRPDPLRALVESCGFDIDEIVVDAPGPGLVWGWIRVLARPSRERGD